eukprot:CAMPEP_0170085528 /NCGR_PEP_ID=MMETSP0019_2-20121128/20387_1 /TAXON_ID=98059 /ORGANISM="Dinobryon sp., Strain UTEXLB2267" /LENGTH=62 /DNA_ID=CAMNT_0010302031 /DNA_START=388 /DNA_END=576 /DNA_ORIENTATION=+
MPAPVVALAASPAAGAAGFANVRTLVSAGFANVRVDRMAGCWPRTSSKRAAPGVPSHRRAGS